MLKSKPVNLVKQFVCYVFGLFLISIGINFSKMWTRDHSGKFHSSGM